MTASRARASIALVMGVVLALLLWPSPAWGYRAESFGPGLTIHRESTDTTASLDVRVYSGYRGGIEPTSTYDPYATGSYTANREYSTTLPFFGARLYESDGSTVLVRLSLSASPYTNVGFWVIDTRPWFQTRPVAIEGTPTVSLDTSSIASMVSTAPLSVDGTLPVSFVGIAGASDVQLRLLSIFLGAVVAVGLFRGFLIVWGEKR